MLSPLLSSADSNSVRVAEAGVRSIIFLPPELREA